MYKLTVVDGPNRGSSYVVQDGETWIGRQAGNAIVLQSSKVSKKHCVLVVDNGELVVRDQGSANGTFVNGVLTKLRKVGPGDRISVGEYVFEVSEPPSGRPRPAPAIAGLGKVVRLPVPVQQQQQGQQRALGFPVGSAGIPGADPNADSVALGDQIPTDLPGKAAWHFERFVMPFFYGLNLKHDWKIIYIGMIIAFVLLNLIVSVYPLTSASRHAIVQESKRRATFMARQIAERNAPFLAANAETKTEIGSVENADGVRLAVLVDMDSRIIAPGTRLNQYLQYGQEAVFAVRARNLFRTGRETGVVGELGSNTIVAVEPVKVLSAQAGRNQIVAMAVVSIDASLAIPDIGEMGMIYSETLILTGILAAFLFYVLYRLTLKPFQILGDDMDKVLKGDMSQITHEFKFQEMDPLWDLIKSALQRVPKGNAAIDMGVGEVGPTLEDYSAPLRLLSSMSPCGVVICDADRKITFMNPMFEEISGIRPDVAIGQDIPSVARDQALGAFVNDVFSRAMPGGEPISEDFDFSGISYKMYAAAFGRVGETPKCYALIAVRNEGA